MRVSFHFDEVYMTKWNTHTWIKRVIITYSLLWIAFSCSRVVISFTKMLYDCIHRGFKVMAIRSFFFLSRKSFSIFYFSFVRLVVGLKVDKWNDLFFCRGKPIFQLALVVWVPEKSFQSVFNSISIGVID